MRKKICIRDEDEVCSLSDAALSNKPHFPFHSSFWCFPLLENFKIKADPNPLTHFCYIWGFCPVKSALANPFHFKQVQAADSFRTRGTDLMHDSSQMTAPARDLQFRGRLGTVEHTDMVIFALSQGWKKVCPSIFSNCTVAAGAGAEDISICSCLSCPFILSGGAHKQHSSCPCGITLNLLCILGVSLKRRAMSTPLLKKETKHDFHILQ